MANVTFSLTDRFIINPVLSMRASLSIDPANPPGLGARICHYANSEGTARVIGAFASVFAAADCAVHLASGIYKGSYLLLSKLNCCCLSPAPWSSQEVRGHFSQAGKFHVLMLIGSIAGAVWPDVFNYFLPSTPIDCNADNGSNEDEKSWTDAPEELLELVKAVKNGEEQAPYERLRNYWRGASLNNKNWFVKIFGSDNSDKFAPVRVELSRMVYRHIDQPIDRQQLHNRRLTWHSGNEIDARIKNVWNASKTFNKGFFFHATPEMNLESILKGRKVEVRHEKLYRGAFVSTRPETSFGPCILVFKRNIERLSRLEHGFTMGNRTYWAGFSQDIPVTEQSLAYIILNNADEGKRQELEKNCNAWTGREIDVISLRNVENNLEAIEGLDMGIPIEWPDEGENVGRPILQHLQMAYAMPVAKAVAQPVGNAVRVTISVAQPVSIYTRIAKIIRRLRAEVENLRQNAQEEEELQLSIYTRIVNRIRMLRAQLQNLRQNVQEELQFVQVQEQPVPTLAYTDWRWEPVLQRQPLPIRVPVYQQQPMMMGSRY